MINSLIENIKFLIPMYMVKYFYFTIGVICSFLISEHIQRKLVNYI